VIGARGIPRRRTDAAVLLRDECGIIEALVAGVAPEFAAHALVQQFGERFRQAVGERLQHDRAVVVALLLEFLKLLLDADAGGHGKRAYIVGHT
jgi:hypothetical protein